MNNIQKLFLLAISFLIANNTPGQKKLTLEESLDIGLKNSKNLKISQSRVLSTKAGIDAVSSQFLPQLKFSANYTRLSDVPPFEVQLPIFSKPITLAETILNNYTFKISIQQAVFTGFRLSAQRRSSEYLKEASEFDLMKDKNDAAFEIKYSFLNFYRALELKTIMDENYRMVENHLNDTKNFFNNGLATQNDVLKMQVQLSNTSLMIIDAENNIELARTAFNKSLGLPLSGKTEINTEEIIVKDNFNDYLSLINEANENRSDLKSTGMRIEATKENITANRSGYFPQVYIGGNYYMSRPNQRYQPPEDVFHGTWDLGITLSWDIWTWGNISSQVIQAEQNLIQVQTLQEQIKDNIELEVNQDYLLLKSAKEKLGVLEKTIEQAEENLRTSNEKYKNQLATSSDLIDAENSVIGAQTSYKTTLVDYQIAKIKLEKALGRKLY